MSSLEKGAFSGVHHINYVVKDLTASVAYFAKVLSQEPTYEDLPLREVKTARFLLGQTYLVLVCPSNPDSEVGKILAQRGEGLFLLSLTTDDLAQTEKALADNGVHITPAGARKGLSSWQVADLEAPNGLGPILQICEDNKHQ